MSRITVKLFSLLAVPAILFSSAFIPANAANLQDYFGYGQPYRTDSGRYFSYHPYVQKAVLVGGAGAAVGALAGGEGNRVNGAVKGALLGAGAGLGYEYLKQHGVFGW